MKLSCFGMKKDNTWKRNHNRKVELGLQYPIYIITSSVFSKAFSQLQIALQRQYITIAFQTSLSSLQKLTQTYKDRYFIILVDFQETPTLIGQFKHLQYNLIEYPKQQIPTILQQYHAFVQNQLQCKMQQRNDGIFDRKKSLVFQKQTNNKNNKVKDSKILSKIQIKSITYQPQLKSSKDNKKLLIFCHDQDDDIYVDYLKNLRQFNIQNAFYIYKIEQYEWMAACKEPDQGYYMLMSENSAFNLIKMLSQIDQIFILMKNIKPCLDLMDSKIAQIASSNDDMNRIISKTFKMQLIKKQEQQSQIPPQGTEQNIYSISKSHNYHQVSPFIAKSIQNIDINKKTSSKLYNSSSVEAYYQLPLQKKQSQVIDNDCKSHKLSNVTEDSVISSIRSSISNLSSSRRSNKTSIIIQRIRSKNKNIIR